MARPDSSPLLIIKEEEVERDDCEAGMRAGCSLDYFFLSGCGHFPETSSLPSKHMSFRLCGLWLVDL